MKEDLCSCHLMLRLWCSPSSFRGVICGWPEKKWLVFIKHSELVSDCKDALAMTAYSTSWQAPCSHLSSQGSNAQPSQTLACLIDVG